MNRRKFFQLTAGLSVAGRSAMFPAAIARGADLPDVFEADPQRKKAAKKKITEARQVALDVLKPSRKELEHGLELHAQSLVIESYGFSPRSAVDGSALANAYEAGASEVELNDLKEEMSMTRCVYDPGERTEYMTAWDAAGVT